MQFDAPPAPDVGPDAWRTAVTLTRAGGYSVAAGQGIFLTHFKDAARDAFAIPTMRYRGRRRPRTPRS